MRTPVLQVPGDAVGARVVGWKCDQCDQVHVSLSFLMMPHGEDGEPMTLAISVTEEVVRHLLENMPGELEHPAPGVDGSILLATADWNEA